ncbi:MAG: winged helix-turn-helix domain-containing protein [Pseudomonadota bacterium]
MITESELTYPTLGVLADAPGGKLATTELREALKEVLPLKESDVEPLAGRPDTKIDQRIRNMKSHKKSVGNVIFEGLVEEVPRGFKITDKGRRHLARRPETLFD